MNHECIIRGPFGVNDRWYRAQCLDPICQWLGPWEPEYLDAAQHGIAHVRQGIGTEQQRQGERGE